MIGGIRSGVYRPLDCVLTLEREQLRPVPALRGGFDPEHLLAIGSVGDRMLILLDIEKFLANTAVAEVTSAH